MNTRTRLSVTILSILLTAAVLITTPAYSQPVLEWETVLVEDFRDGSMPHDLAVNSVGDVLVVGKYITLDYPWQKLAWMSHVSVEGELLSTSLSDSVCNRWWTAKPIGATDFIIGGELLPNLFEPYGVAVARVNQNCDFLWLREHGEDSFAGMNDLCFLPSGNVLVSTFGSAGNIVQQKLTQLNTDGGFLHSLQYAINHFQPGYLHYLDDQNLLVIAGNKVNIPFRMAAIFINPQGQLAGNYIYLPDPDRPSTCTEAVVDDSGHLILVGFDGDPTEPNESYNALMIALDENQEVMWERTWSTVNRQYWYDVCVTTDDNFVLVGWGHVGLTPSSWIEKVDLSSNTIWHLDVPEKEIRCVGAAPDGGFYVVVEREIDNYPNPDLRYMLLQKYAADE